MAHFGTFELQTKAPNSIIASTRSEFLLVLNIYFVLTDFGGSSINIKSKVIKGSILGNDINFDKAKDLYLLIHVILTYQNQNYKEKLINFFHKIVNKIDLNYLIIDDNQWHKIYHLNQYPIDYEPSNILNSINKLLLE